MPNITLTKEIARRRELIKSYTNMHNIHINALFEIDSTIIRNLYVIDIDPKSEKYYPRLMVCSFSEYDEQRMEARLKYQSVDVEGTNISEYYWSLDISNRLWQNGTTYSTDKVLKLFFANKEDCTSVIEAIEQKVS